MKESEIGALSAGLPQKQGLKLLSTHHDTPRRALLSAGLPQKQGLKLIVPPTIKNLNYPRLSAGLPQKQGLKLQKNLGVTFSTSPLSAGLPQKQGLKQNSGSLKSVSFQTFSRTSTKTRIETLLAKTVV